MIINGMRLFALKVEGTKVIEWRWFDEGKAIGTTQPVEGGWYFRTANGKHGGDRRTRREALISLVEYAKCSSSERKQLKVKMPKRGKAEERPTDFKRGY